MKHHRITKSSTSACPETGFTLLELTCSLALFAVIALPILGSIGTSQKTYRTSELRVSLEQKMRAGLELMAQEVSQAGLQPAGVDNDGLAAPLTQAILSDCTKGTAANQCMTGANTTEAIPVTSVANIYVGEMLWVDADPGPDCNKTPNGPCEQVTVIATNPGPPATITATFQFPHSPQTAGGTTYPTPFYGLGQYPHGIVPSVSSGPGVVVPPSGGSTATQLELFGDVNADGHSLLAVIYSCPATLPGPFVRTVYDATSTVTPQTPISTTNLIDNVTFCQFSYPPLAKVPSTCGKTSGDYIVTSVGLTITAQSLMNDPSTHAPVTVTKSFLNIQPRNTMAAVYVACDYFSNELQQEPANLP
jgi:prepilin-type N-terminal cleavage/methylation domain-containing protein